MCEVFQSRAAELVLAIPVGDEVDGEGEGAGVSVEDEEMTAAIKGPWWISSKKMPLKRKRRRMVTKR